MVVQLGNDGPKFIAEFVKQLIMDNLLLIALAILLIIAGIVAFWYFSSDKNLLLRL